MLQPLATPNSRLSGSRAALIQPGKVKIALTCRQSPFNKRTTPTAAHEHRFRLYRLFCAASTTQHQDWQQQQGPTASPLLDPRFGALSTWLEARGGSIGSIAAGDCQMGPVVVRGLVATQDLSPNTPILSVPISSTLQDTKAPQPYPDAPWNVCLATQLLTERSKGHSSSWQPYLATLPSSCCSPLLLPDSKLSDVQYRPAIAAIAAFQATAREAYEKLCQQQQQQQQQQWTWEEWAWALHMVQSRSIRLAQMGCKVMIPGIDLLNHGGTAANGQLVLGKASWQLEGEPAVCFVTTQNISAGQQILWSYGRRGNDDFFAYHGFVLGDNPDEDVVLFDDVQQLLYWAVQNVPQLQALRVQEQQLLAVAEAAAHLAAQEASAYCSSAAIPGTTSSILAATTTFTQAVQQHLQQPDRQPDRQQQQQQQQERWQTQLQRGSSSSSSSGGWRGSSSSGGSSAGGVLESAVLASFKGQQLHRRLASFRLHSPEWGASSCPPTTPELVLRQDGCIDVRIPAVLAALLDATQDTHSSSNTSSSNSNSSSSSSSEQYREALDVVIRQRCQQLLQEMPTTLQQDHDLQQQQQQQQQGLSDGSDEGGLMSAVLQYRMAKKQLLAYIS